ncbi:MAG: NgoFVII family restriction endonuclease [Firmicutes bacterium HGW-Firmicutes-3]|jgi:superfamily II DNA or RNA helicase|nr:MAG: NgoFVII family restriction endonuclease [Firmicutes bacterium HGW-Firmicutes-3]
MQPGIYEQLINEEIKQKIEELEILGDKAEKQPLDEEEAYIILSKYIEEVVRKALIFIREDRRKDRKDKRHMVYQIELCNRLIQLLSENLEEDAFNAYKVSETSELLLSIYSTLNSAYAVNEKLVPVRPATSIASSSLFTGSTKEPDLISELNKEIQSSDRIDMLISFVKWSGLRLIYDELKAFTKVSGRVVRIITTCYIGATDAGAIEKLAQIPGVEIKISYDTKHTRLHAKSYMFHRNTGFTTAYIGSSNMSKVAMTSGLEWNLKVSEKDSFEVVRKFQATFESYWNRYDFESYDYQNESNREKLRTAILFERQGAYDMDRVTSIPLFDIRPYAYQEDILEQLRAEREIFGRMKNLLVAATGVGKTVIAAFDFKRFYNDNPNAKLLFVAHREEILNQALATFRGILKEPNFGEILSGHSKPDSIDHLFVMINSFNSNEFITKTTPEHYDFIIVDEFHHAAAISYKNLLEYYKPQILLGLTATPERMDGKNILEYFDDRIASEMRLPEAIDHKLLAPFHYFCITDDVDLSTLKWTKAGYQDKDLSDLYILNHEQRLRTVINSMERYLTDMEELKGLGFCVSIEHAQYMAKSFCEMNIPALAIIGTTDHDERFEAKQRLIRGDIKMIFTVDVYNEGVDICEVNTVLFLRPTQSLTVFLQQLGRGLRHAKNKDCLTVLDYVGRAHEKYNYEQRFRALLHKSKRPVRQTIEDETLSLPRGCHIKMEKLAKDYILTNIKNAIINKSSLISRVRTFKTETGLPLTLRKFLDYYHIDLVDFYGRQSNRSLYTLHCEAFNTKISSDYNIKIIRKLKNLFYLNSRTIIEQGLAYFKGEQEGFTDAKVLAVYYYSFYDKEPDTSKVESMLEGMHFIRDSFELRNEIIEILEYNYEHLNFVESHQKMRMDSPLDVHCTYTTNQILAGLGYYNEESMPAFREGVLYIKESQTDVFFITLNKSDKDFSEATMYEDYPMNESRFHWQSQNKTSDTSPTAHRYIHHEELGNDVLLFVREYKTRDGHASPFLFMGKAKYVSHTGSRPVSFVWELETPMPARFLEENLNLAN